jgi:hypothetical protein
MAAPALSQLNMNGLEILNARLQNLAANPGTPGEGQYYWNTVTKKLRIYNGSTWDELGTGSGTVTSVAQTVPTGFAIAGSPVTSSGTLAITASGTSGGVLYYASTTTFGVSALLTQHGVMLGGGAGGAPNTIAVGTNNQVLKGNTGAAPSFGSLVQADLPSSVPVSYWAAATAAIAMGTNKITGLGDPTNPQDAATKAYVDQVAQGLDVKGSVRLATTAAGTLATSFANGQTIDTIALVTGDRILIKNQAAAAENGVYTVNASGAPTRSTDMDAWTKVPGSFFFVEIGSTNADTGWVCTSDQGGTLNTTAINFAQFNGAGSITAGAGLTKTGNTIDIGAGAAIQVNADSIEVLVDNSTIEISTSLRVKDNGITFAKILSTIWGTSLDTTGSVVNVKGYTFVTNFTVARIRVISQSIVNGSNTITHSLGTADVAVHVLDASNRHVDIIDVVNTNTTTVTIQNDSPTFSGKVIVIG